MTDFDQRRFELERLRALGREVAGPPSPRQSLAARMIDPAAWSKHAEEHIAWCERHGLRNSTSHFGGQFLVRRRIAHMKAAELLRRLDRQASGLPDLPDLDARALSKRLSEQAFEIGRRDPRRHVSHKAADAVSFLAKADGIPAPDADMGDDGAVTLAWSERGRSAVVQVDTSGGMTIDLQPSSRGPATLDVMRWETTGFGMLAAATDWVHFDGPAPHGAIADGTTESAV